jgi:hypothetical protein
MELRCRKKWNENELMKPRREGQCHEIQHAVAVHAFVRRISAIEGRNFCRQRFLLALNYND